MAAQAICEDWMISFDHSERRYPMDFVYRSQAGRVAARFLSFGLIVSWLTLLKYDAPLLSFDLCLTVGC
jgi:hypothetical protein